ncbi:hypothetical protein AVEN_41283-1 [Araneus ventricosus]|uniref:Uncharacterized protein n=1 Tax=Araneus ventricosus TaxID=182803 RepID=A0A4Y2S724_ARAVE|nr:hypothetical protein AVEN_41283-1 [Araneus ventricosus]
MNVSRCNISSAKPEIIVSITGHGPPLPKEIRTITRGEKLDTHHYCTSRKSENPLTYPAASHSCTNGTPFRGMQCNRSIMRFLRPSVAEWGPEHYILFDFKKITVPCKRGTQVIYTLLPPMLRSCSLLWRLTDNDLYRFGKVRNVPSSKRRRPSKTNSSITEMFTSFR